MSKRHRAGRAGTSGYAGGPQGTRVLAVGVASLAPSITGQDTEIVYSDLAGVTAESLSTLRPELILSPVVTPRFDCLDLAYRLCDLEFAGPYRALARDLPDPGLIRQEIRGHCPGLDFDIITVPDLTGRVN